MENSEPIALFSEPVSLNKNVELKTFPSKSNNYSHLLILNNRHYHINKSTWNLIYVISYNNNLENIRKEYSKLEKRRFSNEDIITGINELLAKRGIVETKEDVIVDKETKYLYFKKVLFSENKLQPISGVLKKLYVKKYFWVILLILIFTNAFIFFSHKPNFDEMLNYPFSMFLFIILSAFSLFFHELGHISACRFYGAKHGEIGGGIYIRYPVLYSDLSDIWKLNNKQRIIVDLGGAYFQLILNIFLYFIYLLTNESFILLVIQVVCIQLFFTLNPFFRFDGYWILCDFLQIPNLRKRSIEYFNYLFEKFVLNKKGRKLPANLNIENKQLKILGLYSILSNLFFIAFIIVCVIYFNEIIWKFWEELLNLFNHVKIISESTESFNALLVYKIIVRILAIFFLVFFFIRISITLINMLKKMARMIIPIIQKLFNIN